MSWQGKGKTAIVGIGYSELSRRPQKSLGALSLDACRAALDDAGLPAERIDGLATFPEAPFHGAGTQDGEQIVSVEYVMNHLPLAPDIRWYAQIETGLIASAVIEGGQRPVGRGVRVRAGLACAPQPAWPLWSVVRQPGSWRRSIHGSLWLYEYFSVARHGPGSVICIATVPLASIWRPCDEQPAECEPQSERLFYTTPMTREDYFAARWIAEPLCLFDCDIPVEGCVALVLTTAERAADLQHPPAYIAGYGQNTSRRRALFHYSLDNYMESGHSLAGKLWASSGLGPQDMSAAELYDGFSPSTLYWLEAAGFCGQGEAYSFIQDGRIALEGELPVNTFGGSLSEGRLHGMGHIAEAVMQVDRPSGKAPGPQRLGRLCH